MAISLEPFERQFKDFGQAVESRRNPFMGGKEGFDALAIVTAVYESCRTGAPVSVPRLEDYLQ
jgi:predicted dehydrogenase